MLQAAVVSRQSAVEEGEDQALQGAHGVLQQHGVEGGGPLLLTCRELVEVRRRSGQAGKAEDEVKLGKLVVALDLFRVDYKLFIDAEEGWLMQGGKQRRPFLEVDVYAAVGKQARWYAQRRLGRRACERRAALYMQEGLGVKLAAWLTNFLQLALEGG